MYTAVKPHPNAWDEMPFRELCSYCGQPERVTLGGVLKRMSRDHVIALKQGGAKGIDNVVPACHRCNASKGNDSLIYFLWRGLPGTHGPPRRHCPGCTGGFH